MKGKSHDGWSGKAKEMVKPAPQAKTYGGLKNSTDIRPQSK
jgi:hypothetical protein